MSTPSKEFLEETIRKAREEAQKLLDDHTHKPPKSHSFLIFLPFTLGLIVLISLVAIMIYMATH